MKVFRLLFDFYACLPPDDLKLSLQSDIEDAVFGVISKYHLKYLGYRFNPLIFDYEQEK